MKKTTSSITDKSKTKTVSSMKKFKPSQILRKEVTPKLKGGTDNIIIVDKDVF